MSLKSKRELLEVVQSHYLTANKLEKQIMLDEFTSATGYHRKYVIRVLKHQVHKHPKRKLGGYKRIYDDLRLYINFFQPSLKLIAKERIGNRTHKRYDPAKTPYQRLLERKEISLPTKAQLLHLYFQLNPAQLRRSLISKQPSFGNFLSNIFW